MLLGLPSVAARVAKQNPPFRSHRSACPRQRVASGACLVTSKSDSPARDLPKSPPRSAKAATDGSFEVADSKDLRCGCSDRKAPTEGGFEIPNLIERLEEPKIGAANRKSQRSEQSQEVVENKGKSFFHRPQSQEVSENEGVIFVKPRGD